MNDYSLTKEVLGANANLTSILWIIVCLLSINLLIELFRFATASILSSQERKNKRTLLIEEKRIKILEELFRKLDSLTLLDKSDNERLLQSLKEINLYVSQNKIYIPKRFQFITNSILDYFKGVLTDFRQKSIEKETNLFQKFCDEFDK